MKFIFKTHDDKILETIQEVNLTDEQISIIHEFASNAWEEMPEVECELEEGSDSEWLIILWFDDEEYPIPDSFQSYVDAMLKKINS